MHLVVITREDPPFSLPRMRVQGELTEIRERDLRFSLSEAQAFLARTIADLAGCEVIQAVHVAGALQYSPNLMMG